MENSSDSGSSDEDMSDLESEPELDSGPEWDMDSYDGREYIPNPDDRQLFNNDNDYDEYCHRRWEAIANRGFLPDIFNGVSPMLNIEPAEDLIALCIDKYNKEKGKTLEYISIVRSNVREGAKFTYYMTIMAREFPNGPLIEYQVKIMAYADNFKPHIPIFCRPSPP